MTTTSGMRLPADFHPRSRQANGCAARLVVETAALVVAFLNKIHGFVELLHVSAVLSSKAGSGRPAVHVQGLPDERLVALFQDGDRQAFELLVRRYQNLAFTVARRYLGSRELAEETAQEVFVSLYKHLSRFRGEASFKSWFYRVLVNHCRNRHKALERRRRRLHDSIDAASEDGEHRLRELPDDGPNPEQALEAVRERALVELALKALGEPARMVLLLRETQGLSYDEISAILGVPAGTVKSRIHRARAELKREVDRLSRGPAGSR